MSFFILGTFPQLTRKQEEYKSPKCASSFSIQTRREQRASFIRARTERYKTRYCGLWRSSPGTLGQKRGCVSGRIEYNCNRVHGCLTVLSLANSPPLLCVLRLRWACVSCL